jgi:hypothetical protein
MGHAQQFISRVPRDDSRWHAIMEGDVKPNPTVGPDGKVLPE